MPERKQTVRINEHAVNLTNLDKTLYPDSNIIKAEIIQYYLTVAPFFLHFGKRRLLSLIRYPNGIKANKFYSKNTPKWKPDWVSTRQLDGDDNQYMLLQGTQDLVWLANLAALEIHAMNKRWEDKLLMDHIVFDLDPPDSFNYIDLRNLTFKIGEYLSSRGLPNFVKTSGSRGAHIYIPIMPTIEYQIIIDIVKKLAKEIQKTFPKETTNHFRKESRKGKILIDINRNFEAQTTILPFSTRAKEGAPISMPLNWTDFKKTASSQDFNIKNAIEFLTLYGNAWENFSDHAIDLIEWNSHSILGPEPSLPIKRNELQTSMKSETPHLPSSEVAANLPSWFSKPSYQHMLAGVTNKLLSGTKYVYENKWDGIRVFLYIYQGLCKIYSRSGREITDLFPDIKSPSDNSSLSVVLDGEIVVTDKHGRPDFPSVISRLHNKSAIDKQITMYPAIFYVFDLLRIANKDICSQSWVQRRGMLIEVLKELPTYRLSQSVTEGQFLLDAAQQMNLEGIMIKRLDSTYQAGKRTDAWLKLKFRDNIVCVILGYTMGEGSRNDFFGSLHIAELKEDMLYYRGRVGSGFDQAALISLGQLFKAIPKSNKWIEAETEENSKTIWFENHLPYCDIQYARQTQNGTLREPVFKKLTGQFYDRY